MTRPGGRIGRAETIALALLALASLVLRGAALFRYRIDSDEPQHLHVAWGWTAGLVQYRDVFDNHAPLFHIVTAPIVAALGERSDILPLMRLPMLPLWIVVLVATWMLAREISVSNRAALWSVLLLSLFPTFFLKSIEYRNDNLWVAVWMVALVAIARARYAAAAFLLGIGLAVSLKTAPLVIAVVLAGGIAAWHTGVRPRVRMILTAAFAFAVVPAAVAGGFAAAGAWEALRFCLFDFNSSVAEMTTQPRYAPLAYPFALFLIFHFNRRRSAPPLARFFANVCALFVATIASFWPLISPRDFLAILPLLAILLAPKLEARAAMGLAVAFVAALFYYAEGFENRTDEYTTMLDQTLGLTRPGEPVIDLKGELIFRPRPFYYALESVTRRSLVRGRIRDTIAEDVVRARCYVAQADGPIWPPRGRRFLSANFVNLGRLRAAGQWIAADGRFSIAIPGEYIVLNEFGPVRGTLDGSPHTGPRFLAAGPHRFERTRDEPVVVVWAPAYVRGYSPFHLRDLKF